MPIVQHHILNDLCYRLFSATGIPEPDARTVADHVVASHLNGHDSHGTWLAPNYARSMQKGYVPWEDTETVRDTPTLRVVNGKGANGIVACNKAIDIAVAAGFERDSVVEALVPNVVAADMFETHVDDGQDFKRTSEWFLFGAER